MICHFKFLSDIKFRLVLKKYFPLLLPFILFGCSIPYSVLPETETFSLLPLFSIVVVGEGQAYRFSEGAWMEVPSYNYEFTVLQRRYKNRWESIKEIHRRHPLYDGRAGQRDQTHYFIVRFDPALDKRVEFFADTSLGKGKGWTDSEFRSLAVELTPANISRFAPFNTYRITQSYKYEEGYLRETVELFKKKDGKEEPFMKMEEKAMIYVFQKLPGAPTKAE